MLAQNEKRESLSKITILYLSWKDYFSFERSKKSFISNSIQQFFMCFLAMYTMHLRRFDYGFSVHFLFILVVSNKLFKLPNSLLLCVLCVHYPPKEIWFRVGTHFLFVLIITDGLFQHVYYCVCCVCIVHFIRRFDLRFGTHFLCPSSYRPWLFIWLLLSVLYVHCVHALDKPWRVHS